MRKILKIAKLELSILVYSPVVWLVLPIFFVLCGLGFIDNLQNTLVLISYGKGKPLTTLLFGGEYGLFTTIQQTLYLYLPILTMSLMSRETNSGSIKLLLSSPVKLREIILGKYLAIVALGLAFIAILAVFGVIGFFSVPHMEVGMVISGLFGLFLLVCTYAAIGLFMSCLTIYQIVAAIATLSIFVALRYVGDVWQSVNFVRDLTYFLSISGRTDLMIAGLIKTADVFYYLIVIYMFLSFSILYLKNQRELKTWKVKLGKYLLVFTSALALGYITSRPALTGYLDTTVGKSMSLTDAGQEIAKKIDGELKITTYVNLLSPGLYSFLPQKRNADLGQQEPYRRYIPGMKNEYVYYYHLTTDTTLAFYKNNPLYAKLKDTKAIAEKVAYSMDLNIKDFMTPDEIDKMIDLKSEGYLHLRKLEYKGRTTTQRLFVLDQDAYPKESEWMASLKQLLGDTAKMVFLTGNNESDIINKNDRGYKTVAFDKTQRKSFINQGFDVDTLNLNTQDIPDKGEILVMGDPTVPFSAAAEKKLSDYIKNGGNMLITTNPGRQDIVNPILSKLGLQLKNGMLVKPDKDMAVDKIKSRISSDAVGMDRNIDLLHNGNWELTLKEVSAIAYSDSSEFKIKSLWKSPDGGWNKVVPLDINATALEFNSSQGDQKGIFATSVALTRNVKNKEQRIIVTGDADFMSNVELDNFPPTATQMNINSIFRWLAYGKFPVDEIRPNAKDIDITVSKEQISAFGIVCKFVLPAILVVIGMIVLFKRRRN
ncbi:ABC-2 type transport system permease protein [Pedobacter steynii]|uniref:ABC-2 type transport system permease protein n=1 Tax=Pedobacter steynii TaxID=430522 RepID=A0A1G9P5T2_9SPHI|nr:Gldg family protein [Pedobacter steynii]NQX39084.1 Gldg family protein [Pedobacter steynii]SDL94156.1 ABC-2 type transport system permease protein [Pedobacter steynii]